MLADNLGIDDDESDEEEDGREDDDVDEDDPRARYAYGSDDEHDVDAEIAPWDLDKVYNATQTRRRKGLYDLYPPFLSLLLVPNPPYPLLLLPLPLHHHHLQLPRPKRRVW